MDHLLAVALCGTAFAIPWGVGGAVFGGVARVFAQKWRRSPEKTAGRAFKVGAVSGATFTAVLGFLVGGWVGYFHGLDSAALFGQVVTSCSVLGIIAIVAVILGTIGYSLEQLGVSSRQEIASSGDDRAE